MSSHGLAVGLASGIVRDMTPGQDNDTTVATEGEGTKMKVQVCM